MSYTPNATAGDDILTGDAQPDVIDALEGDDIIFGGGGDDELLGGPGNDRLYGEAGNDRLLGGTGDDRYQVDRTDTVTEQVDEGTDSIYFRDDSFTGIYFLAANVENLTMIGRFNNLSAFGNSLDNRIYGNNTGNDTLLGGAGHDYIQGDFAYLNGSNSFSSDTGEDLLRGGAGDDVIWGDQGEGKELIHSLANDRLYGDNGDDILYGQAGADVLDGGLGNDALYGGAGNDVLDGGFDLLPPGKEADLFGSDYFPGNDVLAGGAGDDVYLFGRSSRSDRVLETAAAGEANQLRFEDGVIAADVAVRHEGNDLNFYIVGFADNKLSVVDYFSASARPLTTAVFSDGTVWTTAELDAAPLGPVGTGDRFIRGTDGNETLRGPDGNDTIDGKDGADRIFGGGGNDYLLGGAGRDVLSGDAGDDLLNGGGDGDRLLGGTGADTLLGDIGDDFLDGGAGPDVLDGGAGANRLIFQRGDGQDIVRGAATSGGADRTSLELVTSYAVGSLGAVPVGIASSEVTLTRQGDHLVIDRNDGDDRITVENYFTSAPGNLYPVHAIQFSDTAWNNADINARVVSGDPVPPVPAGTTQTGTPGNDVMTGTTGDDTLFGRAGNDQLSGGAGNDFLNGELGQDQMFGGIGNDTVIVDDAGDYVWEAEGEGMDTVQSYISYALQDNFEILILIGQTEVVANGNALANLIQGNDAGNVIDGRGGQDSLWGLGGNDALTIHSGQEDVSGGMGVDTLRVAAELGMLDLAGRAGQTFTGLEAIDLTNSSATTLRLTMGSLLAISTESDSLQIDGDAGDVLQIESGWVKSATATAGYDQYTRTEGADSGSLRVTEGMAVAMGVWV